MLGCYTLEKEQLIQQRIGGLTPYSLDNIQAIEKTGCQGLVISKEMVRSILYSLPFYCRFVGRIRSLCFRVRTT